MAGAFFTAYDRGAGPSNGVYGRAAVWTGEWPCGRADAWQELRRILLAQRGSGAGRCGLSRYRARSSRLGQVLEAGYSLQLSAFGSEYGASTRFTWNPGRYAGRAFNRRDARGSVRADVSGASDAARPRRPDWPRRLSRKYSAA